MKKVVIRKKKSALTPLNKKLLIVLVVVVLAGAVIAIFNGGVTGFASLTGTNSRAALLAYRDLAAQTNPDGVAVAQYYTGDMDRDGIPDTYDRCTTIRDTIRTRRTRVAGVYRTVALPPLDSDRDGVPNNCDKYPLIDHEGRGEDADGDGVPNNEERAGRVYVGADQQRPTRATARATTSSGTQTQIAGAARPSGTGTPVLA